MAKELKEILFPHEKIRKTQDAMISDVHDAIKNKKNIIVHAPTGIGKTVSVLAPALSYAIGKDVSIFFLTSKHTQHKIAIETLKQIKKKYARKPTDKLDSVSGTNLVGNNEFNAADIIGKKWMCLQGVEALNSGDFADYCKKLRDENKCEFCLNTIKKSRMPTVLAENSLNELKVSGPMHVEELVEICRKAKLCPYEMASMLAKESKAVIADYNYIFNSDIRDSFFSKANKKLENSIIIIDEGHNLPARARELLTAKLSSFILDMAIKEANKLELFNALVALKKIKEVFDEMGFGLDFNREEKLVRKHEFVDKVNERQSYDNTIAELSFAGDLVREKQKQSYVGSVGKFLEAWLNQDNGFARILTKNFSNGNLTLSYRCLDPSLITREVITRSYSTIIMSGTLTPTAMYKDILGFEEAVERAYENPFPKGNRLCLIIPETTTKFTRRGNEEYNKIAEVCNKIVNKIPGNAALFFPSYDLRDKVYKNFYGLCKRKMLIEKQNLGKKEKEKILDEFKKHKDKGAVLLGVSTGNFGEGIDLPGDFLKGVIIVGLPLEKPDLETKELIDYYEEKFGKGFDYGYIFPAMTKCLQNAGRCIRSETDKGVIIFLDERFAWNNYLRCIPEDMNFKISKMYEERIERFFGG
ncbi:ATP-dependent DNA helicase [Candidatus Woesearchaeota archaeon]|nr:ATP-dependent DNA helicase [Candidatus Woesearchaeota archaeon]